MDLRPQSAPFTLLSQWVAAPACFYFSATPFLSDTHFEPQKEDDADDYDVDDIAALEDECMNQEWEEEEEDESLIAQEESAESHC